MCHEDRHAGGYGAGVKVVHGNNMWHLFQMGPHFVKVKSVGRFFQEHADRIVQELDGAWNHHERDDAAGNRVEASPAGADEYDRRYDYGYGSQGIVHNFEERRFHVHVVFALRCEDED